MIAANNRRGCIWVLAHDVSEPNTPIDKRVYEYFTGQQGEMGGPSRSPFRADAYKFSSAKSARECAETHNAMRDSPYWVVLPVFDSIPAAAPKPPRIAQR